jgi:hypothetical protein
MQDNELPPIEGELTDEDLRQVAGTTGSCINSTVPTPTPLPSQNSQGNDNSQGNEDQGNPPVHRRW